MSNIFVTSLMDNHILQIVESHSIESIEEEAAAKAELIKQKEEMILCLQVPIIPCVSGL